MSFDARGMLTWAETWCNAANVGYSQTYRTMQTYNGVTYFDCSSFTFFAMWLGGGLDVGALGYSTDLSKYQSIPRTANAWSVNGMVNKLRQLNWVQVGSNTADWLPGDILVKTSAHCEILYSTGPLKSAGAHGTGGGTVPLADQVSIRTILDPSYYDQIWRNPDGPIPPGPGPRPHGHMPVWLIKKGLEGDYI